MSATAYRIADWIWRDLSLRAGFREIVDQNPGRLTVDYWAQRIDEEIGDNRYIAALEKIAAGAADAVHIAKRALGPAKDEKAERLGIKQYAADGEAHTVKQLDLGVRLTRAPDFQRLTAEDMERMAEQERKITQKITQKLKEQDTTEEEADI